MKSMGKIVSVILAVMIIFSSMSGVLGIMASAEETNETETVTITESPREHLKEQMRSLYAEAKTIADAEGKKVGGDDELNGVMTVSQTGPWYVYSTNDTSDNWKHTTGYWYRADTSSNLDLRYGHSNWSYTTASVRVSYKDGASANGEALTALLRPNSGSTDSRYNDFVGLYYEAEVSGEYRISDNLGGFYVRKSAASGYNAYITVYAVGKEIYKSAPISRANRRAEFDDITVTLEKGDKIEYRFTYEGAAESYSGDIEFDFDPQITLLSQTEEIVLDGDGEVTKVLYDALDLLDASGTNASAKGVQTAVWRAEMYSSGTWKDLTYYCNHSKVYTRYLDWGYNESSHSQTDRISIRYKGSQIANGLIVRAHIPMWRSNMKHARLAYTAEADGIYTLTDKFGEFVVSTGALIQYDYWIQITHNGSVLWKSDILANKGETAEFDGVTLNMSKGDILAIEFKYSKKSTATATYEEGSFDVDFAPVLNYAPVEKNDSTEKQAYTPVKEERYYAENIASPKTVAAYVKTNEKNLGGAVVSSENFTLDITNKGYPRVILKDSEIVFPVDIRANGFNHIAVSCNSERGEWYLYLNGIKVSTVAGEAISAESIDKLYVGASVDEYNNNYFKGSFAELAVYSKMLTDSEITALTAGVDTDADSLMAYWNLADGDKADGSQNEKTLVSETVLAIAEIPESGITFTKQSDRLDSYEVYASAVNTFETWVKVDSTYREDKSPGCILSSYFGNLSVSSVDYLEINIGTNGNPLLEIRSGGVTESFRFNADVTTGQWLHLAISADYEKGFYNCYINGELADSVAVGTLQIPVSHRAYHVSGYYIHNISSVYFDGSLAGMKLYSDLRTADEIRGDLYSTDINDDNLMAYWKMQNKEDGLKDLKGTNDLHFLLNDTADEVIDESFGNYSTFVFIPDPQFINEVKGASAMSKITDWILANKEKENIVGVMGLGDITDNNTAKEWSAAATAFGPLKGQIPFVFVGGNHDIEYKNPSADNPRDVSMFNTYFPYDDWAPYMSGFYEEGKIDNMYYLLEDVNGEKYMMLGLEFQPRDAVLEWANKVVSEHSDYKVIVATHGYQSESYTTGENIYIASNSYKDVVGTDANVGNQIWEKFVSQHENIKAILCGHVASEDICYTTNTGVNGNTVIEILVDAQGMERPLDMLGAVMVLRVSEDGTKANINYYSTIKNKFIKDLNQFNVDWIAEPYVAEIDSTKFETFEDAVLQAQDGDTITLLDDVTVADSIVISKNISIDTANYGISNKSANALFEIADGMGMRFDGGVYTFDDDGIIADTDANGKVDSNDLAYIRQKLLGKSDDTAVYDINGDGAVDICDLVRIKKLAGNI